jgi:hypothetical protein
MSDLPPLASPTGAPRWRENELIVDSSHLDTVRDLLDELGVLPADELQDPRLGLAALRFDREFFATRSIAGLAEEIRRLASERWNGWEPTVGKNRIMSQIGGERVIDIGAVGAQRVIDIGGEGTPRPAEATDLRPRDVTAGVRSRLAVVDTGIVPQPWLDGAYRCDPDTVLDPAAVVDEPAAHHGTFVAGLVLQAAGGCQLWIEKGLRTEGDTDSWSLATTLADLAERGVDVVNLSLGCFTDDDQPPLVLQRAVDCFGGDAVVVAAAGNYATTPRDPSWTPGAVRPSFPAALQNVVAVGSVDEAWTNSDFSPVAPWIDVRAVGGDVASTYGGPGDDAFRTWSGTSFAAATVSGVLARESSRSRITAREAWRQILAGELKPAELQTGH